MRRVIAAGAIVLGFAFTSSAIGQDVKTKTKIKGDDAQTVTYTGCVADGPQTRTFVLNKVMPVGQTTETTTDASGASSTTTTTTLRASTCSAMSRASRSGRRRTSPRSSSSPSAKT